MPTPSGSSVVRALIPAPIGRSRLPAKRLWSFCPPGCCGTRASANSWKRRGCCARRGVKARFALVGKPDPANPASVSQAEIDAWVSEGAVECWGWQDDMPSIFAQAQIVCLPTYHEGFPKSLLEAAASGCAIVTTDIAGCREIVRHGVTGWLVPTRDAQALASALQQAIEQPGLRERYGASARALVETDFSASRVASDTIAVYDELMARYL